MGCCLLWFNGLFTSLEGVIDGDHKATGVALFKEKSLEARVSFFVFCHCGDVCVKRDTVTE